MLIETPQFNVGDDVAIVARERTTRDEVVRGLSKIATANRRKIVLEDGTRWNPDGTTIGKTGFRYPRVVRATAEHHRIRRCQALRGKLITLRAEEWDAFSIEQIEQVAAILFVTKGP